MVNCSYVSDAFGLKKMNGAVENTLTSISRVFTDTRVTWPSLAWIQSLAFSQRIAQAAEEKPASLLYSGWLMTCSISFLKTTSHMR